MSPINVALIGCGLYAKENYSAAIDGNANLKLVALYSRSWRSAANLKAVLSPETQSHIDIYGEDATGGELAGSLDDLLARTNIHAVVVAVPIPNLYHIVQLAVRSGKHVLSEKPIAAHMHEATALIREHATQASEATWYVAENWRMLAAVNTAVAHLRQGDGTRRILGFRMRQSLLMPSDSPFLSQSEWRSKTGLLLDGAIHGVAVLRQLLFFSSDPASSLSLVNNGSSAAPGSILNVAAFSNHLQPHLPGPDTIDCIAQAETASGIVTGTLQFSYGTTFPGPVWEIAFDDGVLCINGFSHVTFAPVDIDDCETKALDVHESEGLGETITAVLEAWISRILGHTTMNDQRLDPIEAGRDLQLLSSILKSAEQHGQPVTVRQS